MILSTSRVFHLLRTALLLLFVAVPLLTTGPNASAQGTYDYSGWYDGGDGCYYWWDGYQYTGDVDCNGDGYADSQSTAAAGWYDYYGDGCLYWFDGSQYTGAVD